MPSDAYKRRRPAGRCGVEHAINPDKSPERRIGLEGGDERTLQ